MQNISSLHHLLCAWFLSDLYSIEKCSMFSPKLTFAPELFFPIIYCYPYKVRSMKIKHNSIFVLMCRVQFIVRNSLNSLFIKHKNSSVKLITETPQQKSLKHRYPLKIYKFIIFTCPLSTSAYSPERKICAIGWGWAGAQGTVDRKWPWRSAIRDRRFVRSGCDDWSGEYSYRQDAPERHWYEPGPLAVAVERDYYRWRVSTLLPNGRSPLSRPVHPIAALPSAAKSL